MAALPWITYLQRMVGRGHPTLADTLNTPLRTVLSQSGYNPDATTFPGLPGPVFNVKAYGALADGVAVDAPAILATCQAAQVAGGGLIWFPDGIYNFGNRSANDNVINLTAATNLHFWGWRVAFVMNTTDDSQPGFFYLTNPENCSFGNLAFRDTGTNLAIDWHGARCIQLVGTGAAAFHANTRIVGCQADSVVTFLNVGNTVDTPSRVRDIVVDNCVVRNSYYGVVCQENGDGLRGNWRCENVRRAYFAYGVTDHSVEVSVYHDGVALGANSACLIKRYARDTKAIALKARFFGSVAQYSTGVTLEHQPIVTGTGVIEDVAVDLHISEDILPANYAMTPFRFRSYTSAGVEETSTTTNRWDNITYKGSPGPVTTGTAALAIGCTQAVEGKLQFDSSVFRAIGNNAPHYPGFIVRLAHDREARTILGDLTTQTITLPLIRLNAEAFVLRVVIYAHDNFASLAVQNCTFREDVLVGYNASGGAVVIQSTTNLHKILQGTEAVVAYTASGENIIVSFTGAPYSNAQAFARVELQFVSRGPLY